MGKVAYWLDLPDEIIHIYNTFPISQFGKCLADESAMVPLDYIQIDER